MRHTTRDHGRRSGRARSTLAALLVAAVLGGCNNADILDVIDPDLVTPESVTQAELYWAGAIGDFTDAVGSAGGINVYVGLFTDEFHLSGTFPTRIQVDERDISKTNGSMEGVFRDLHHARNSAENAIGLLEEEDGSDPRIAGMYNLAGYTYMLFGEVYCSGVPFGRTPIQGDPVQGEPLSRDEMYQAAIDRFDLALSSAGASAQEQNMARMGRARGLLNLGQYSAAAAEVSGIPDGFVYWMRHHDDATDNGVKSQNHDQGRWSLSEVEGENGLPFRSAADPRMPWELDPEPGFDAQTPLYKQLLWTTDDDDVALASKLEARLIEAEALLNDGDVDGWLGILNDLRADPGAAAVHIPEGTEALAPLSDPGSEDARVRMHFDERGWWLFGQGFRLGDLRRMVRQYGFAQDEVFPTGQHFKGSAYGTQVNFPIPEDEETNPNFTACADTGA